MQLTRCTNGHYYDKHKYNTCPMCNEVVSPRRLRIERCENGHFFDKNKYESCPHCENAEIEEDKTLYQWDNQLMDKSQIIKFCISYGDFPIKCIDFYGIGLKKYNRINGSRDGWMNFPDEFFDEKIFGLYDEKIDEIKKFITSIDIENWETDDYIISNIKDNPPGFCVNDSFSCEFANGTKFYCAYPPREEFNKLIDFLEEIKNFRYIGGSGINFETPIYWELVKSKVISEKITIKEDVSIGDIVKLKSTGQIVEIVKKNFTVKFNGHLETVEFGGKLINSDDEGVLLFSKAGIEKKYSSDTVQLFKRNKLK